MKSAMPMLAHGQGLLEALLVFSIMHLGLGGIIGFWIGRKKRDFFVMRIASVIFFLIFAYGGYATVGWIYALPLMGAIAAGLCYGRFTLKQARGADESD
ncbi:MAG: hypothetical protein HZA89_06815 [Verrucomicrobia bacterium]|nr:hypothetical protein [Verrucomicrobiota bacterium]